MIYKSDEFDFPSDSVEEQKLKDKVVRENFYKVLMESTEIYYSILQNVICGLNIIRDLI